jgi:ArsR family transcriptional regulator, arsenate/arsenite/antimonite-responsive transcriptional repressor / arsenate reductase (thioredoxin)
VSWVGRRVCSQIAEALLRDIAGDTIEVASAGSHPKPVHPNAIKVLAERGIDIAGALQAARAVPRSSLRLRDHVVRQGSRGPPGVSEQPQTVHWSIEDPSRPPGTLPVFRALDDELESRLGFLISLIDNQSQKETARHG